MCSLEDINDWTDIDPFIMACAIEKGLLLEEDDPENLFDNLEFKKNLDETYCDLHGSEVYEAGHSGGGGANDCLIHSLFSCLSSTFRALKSDEERNVIAHFFRRTVLIDWLEKGFIHGEDVTYGQPGKETPIKILTGTTLLSQNLGDVLCRKFKVNILWVSEYPYYNQKTKERSNSKDVNFADNGSNITICIYGDGGHFRPVNLVIGPEEAYVQEGFDGEEYSKRCFHPITTYEKKCDFERGDHVIYKGEPYEVVGRDWDTDKVPPECKSIDIKKDPTNIDEASIKVPVTEVTKAGAGGVATKGGSGKTKRRRRRSTKKRIKRRNRKTGKKRR